MALASRAAEQVEVWQLMVFRSLLQQTLVIEQMLEPTYFENNFDNFPITWDNATPVTFADVKATDPSSISKDDLLDFTTNYVTYKSTDIRSANLTNFEKIVTNLLSLWK